MMLKVKSLLSAVLLGACGLASAQVKHFEFEPRTPKPGESVQIIYDPQGTPLAGQKEVHAVVYSYNNYHWQTSDLALQPVGDKYKAAITLDKQCGIAAFKFKAGDSTDNDKDLGYVIMTVDPEHAGVNAAGAYAGWGFLRTQNRGYGIPGYYKNLAISDTAFYYWMNNEIRWHSKEAAQTISVPFVRSLYAYQGAAGMPRIERVIAFLKQSGGEENLLRVRQIYLQVLDRKTSADSLDAVLLTQYPKGSIARLKAYKTLTSERNLDQMQKLAVQFLQNFQQNGNADFDEQNHISYANVYQTAIILATMKGDYSLLNTYIDRLPFSALINLYYKIIQIPHDRKDVPDTKLLPYARMLVNRMELLKGTPSAESWYLSPQEWEKQYEQYVESSVLPVHINLLRLTGNDKEALTFAERAEKYYNYKKASVNNDYALLLNKSKQYSKLNEVLVKSIYENQSSPEMVELLKADYIRNNKSEAGFDKYFNTLKNPALAAKSSEEIKSIMRKADVPDWQMLGLDGKAVKFSELRGKTIVMDFWATWCVPCKASFPGMKLAVERYKNDPNVVFYFVDTDEHGEGYKAQVAKYMKDNSYPFKVLFDNKAEGAKQNDEVFARICKAYQTSGIPMKLIIDPKGKLRFLTDGYKGSATALADEIAEMVELAKKAE